MGWPGHRLVDLAEEGEHIGGGVAPAAFGDDLSGGDVQGREQICGAVAFAVVGHCPGSART